MFTPEQEAFLADFANKSLAILAKGQIDKATNTTNVEREALVKQLQDQSKTTIEETLKAFDLAHNPKP